jgi:hypothetical protein
MHGGNNPGAPRGERHGNYKHGLATIEAQQRRQYWKLVHSGLLNTVAELDQADE